MVLYTQAFHNIYFSSLYLSINAACISAFKDRVGSAFLAAFLAFLANQVGNLKLVRKTSSFFLLPIMVQM